MNKYEITKGSVNLYDFMFNKKYEKYDCSYIQKNGRLFNTILDLSGLCDSHFSSYPFMIPILENFDECNFSEIWNALRTLQKEAFFWTNKKLPRNSSNSESTYEHSSLELTMPSGIFFQLDVENWFLQKEKDAKFYMQVRPCKAKLELAPESVQKEIAENENLKLFWKLLQYDLADPEVAGLFFTFRLGNSNLMGELKQFLYKNFAEFY